MAITEKVFITGATGFVGSYITRLLLAKGYKVKALRRSNSQLDMLGIAADQVEWIDGDLLDIPALEDALVDIDKVYHCAAVVSYDPKKVKEMMTINVEGTANLINVALFRGVKKLVHISSIASLGQTKDGSPISENTKWERDKNASNYSISKFLAEQEVWRGHAEGLAIGIINPSIILGAGRWDQSSIALFKQVWDGLKVFTAGTKGFVDVRDVANMAIQVMESDINGERFIANGCNISFQKLFTLIAEGLNKKPPSYKASPLLTEIVWRTEWLKSRLTGKSPLITKETARSSSNHAAYDNQKSVYQLNFQYTPIEQTIKETTQLMLATHAKTTAVLDFKH